MNQMAPVPPHKSTIGGLDANVVALFTYLSSIILSFIPFLEYIAWLAPLIFFLVEKQSPFVRYHSMQAFIINLFGLAVNVVVGVIIGGILMASFYTGGYYGAIGGGIVSVIISIIVYSVLIVIAVFEIIAMVKAYRYEEYEMPIIGRLAHKMVG